MIVMGRTRLSSDALNLTSVSRWQINATALDGTRAARAPLTSIYADIYFNHG